MESYQQRVVDEKQELDERRQHLKAFIWSDAFEGVGVEERTRMKFQAKLMEDLSAVLAERIQAFKMIKYSEDFTAFVKESYPLDEKLINAVKDGLPTVCELLINHYNIYTKGFNAWTKEMKKHLAEKSD